MSDFHQSGVLSTLHRLGRDHAAEAMHAKLVEYAERRPVALVLPCLYSELDGPALRSIVEHLREANYVREIVVGLDRANKKEFQEACRFFSVLPQQVRI